MKNKELAKEFDKELQELIAKYKINIKYFGNTYIYDNKGSWKISELIVALQKFLEDHKVEDGTVAAEVDYDYFAGLRLDCQRVKTEAEILADVDYRKQVEKHKKDIAKTNRKVREADEIALYKRLHKKHGHKNV